MSTAPDPFIDPSIPQKKAVEIEQAIFDSSGDGSTNNDYRAAVREKLANLRDQDNTALNKDILKGNLSANQLAERDAQDLASAARKQENHALRQQGLQDSIGIDTLQEKQVIDDPQGRRTNTVQDGIEFETAD